MLSKKTLYAGSSILIIIILLLIFNKSTSKVNTTSNPTSQPPSGQSDPPKIISTKPDPLDNTVIPADQVIEITFNRSLQNVPEFRIRFDPVVDYKVELSGDRKTAKIIFNKPLDLGTTYNLDILPETKFDGVGNWGQDKSFQFRTIKYTGV